MDRCATRWRGREDCPPLKVSQQVEKVDGVVVSDDEQKLEVGWNSHRN